MRLIELRSSDRQPRPNGRRTDWMTYLLIAAAILLTAAAVFIGADLWMRSPFSRAIVQALGMIDAPIAASAQLEAGESPTAQAASAAPPVGQPIVEPGIAGPNTPPPCVPPNDWGLHIVQKGNTLQTVADRYGAEVKTLMRVNCLNTQTIFVGQRLYVPGGLAFPMLETPMEGWPFTPDSGGAKLASAVPPADAPSATPTSTPTRTHAAIPTTPAGSRSGPTATPKPGDSRISPTTAPGETANPVSSTPSPISATDLVTATSSIPLATDTPAPTGPPTAIAASGLETGMPDAPLPPSPAQPQADSSRHRWRLQPRSTSLQSRYRLQPPQLRPKAPSRSISPTVISTSSCWAQTNGPTRAHGAQTP